MTAWDVWAALGRRWYVVLVGLGVTLGVLAGVARVEGVYVAQVDVVFLAPATSASPNRIASASNGVIATAGLVQRLVDPAREDGSHLVSTSAVVSLVGQGVRNGSAVVLPDTGGQWDHSFSRPVLSLEVTGSTADDVRVRAEDLVARVQETTRTAQVDAGVIESNAITTYPLPATPQVEYRQGHRSAALLVTLLLSLWATVFLTLVVDRRLGRPLRLPRVLGAR